MPNKIGLNIHSERINGYLELLKRDLGVITDAVNNNSNKKSHGKAKGSQDGVSLCKEPAAKPQGNHSGYPVA